MQSACINIILFDLIPINLEDFSSACELGSKKIYRTVSNTLIMNYVQSFQGRKNFREYDSFPVTVSKAAKRQSRFFDSTVLAIFFPAENCQFLPFSNGASRCEVLFEAGKFDGIQFRTEVEYAREKCVRKRGLPPMVKLGERSGGKATHCLLSPQFSTSETCITMIRRNGRIAGEFCRECEIQTDLNLKYNAPSGLARKTSQYESIHLKPFTPFSIIHNNITRNS